MVPGSEHCRLCLGCGVLVPRYQGVAAEVWWSGLYLPEDESSAQWRVSRIEMCRSCGGRLRVEKRLAVKVGEVQVVLEVAVRDGYSMVRADKVITCRGVRVVETAVDGEVVTGGT